MITDLTTSMLYICPECSTSSLRSLSAFEIKKNDCLSLSCMNKKCQCNNVVILPSKDKYKISIDCPVCGYEHSFSLSKKTIWNKNFMILNCPQSGFGILFIGKDIEHLKKEHNAQAEIIAGIVANNDELYDQLDLLFEIVELINSYANKNKIHCQCPNGNIAININTDSVTLTCKSCGRSATFEAKIETISALSELIEIIL